MMAQRKPSIEVIESLGIRRVTLVGLSFKQATDDLRESPFVRLAERLLGKGYHLKLYDPDVDVDALRGRNLQYVQLHLEHIGVLQCERLEEALEEVELLIIGKLLVDPEKLVALCPTGTVVLDLSRTLPAELPPLKILHVDGVGATEAKQKYKQAETVGV